jgi:hypothetical protein
MLHVWANEVIPKTSRCCGREVKNTEEKFEE